MRVLDTVRVGYFESLRAAAAERGGSRCLPQRSWSQPLVTFQNVTGVTCHAQTGENAHGNDPGAGNAAVHDFFWI
jgi:hypothetical protein